MIMSEKAKSLQNLAGEVSEMILKNDLVSAVRMLIEALSLQEWSEAEIDTLVEDLNSVGFSQAVSKVVKILIFLSGNLSNKPMETILEMKAWKAAVEKSSMSETAEDPWGRIKGSLRKYKIILPI